ncbi:MAG: sodium-independent anion transporter, partial [Cyclonatronaceae bacterium]
ERYDEARRVPGLLIFRFDAQLYFANIEFFRGEIERRINLRSEAGDEINALLLDFGAVSNIDSSGIHAIQDVLQELDERGIKVLFAGVIGPVRDRFEKAGLLQALGQEAFFFDVEDGVKYHEEGHRPVYNFSVLQTNSSSKMAQNYTS